MRQIITLPDGKQAELLADYLLTQQIRTKLEWENSGWALWVCDEDQVDLARQIVKDFTQNPTDSRYKHAANAAHRIRQEEEWKEEQYNQKLVEFNNRIKDLGLRPRVPVTWSFIVLAVALAVITNLGEGEFTKFLWIANGVSFFNWRFDEPFYHGEIWRLLTPCFIHLSPLHLVFNLMWIYILGSAIEQLQGSWLLLLFFAMIGVISNLAQYYVGHMFWKPEIGLVFILFPWFGGLSGVNYGLFGYVWMMSRYQPDRGYVISDGAIVLMIGWLLLCFTGLLGPVANTAHAIGLLIGVVLALGPRWWRRILKPN